ncbi:MAG: type II secretion system protein [Syntrophobacterales bacterium]|nr:MAG: type II secretion system protein [Syntrophobacterales bacterium]
MVKKLNQKGFSLLEIIVSLVLVAIVGAMVVSFMGTQVTQSGRSVTWINDEFELSEVMEKMLAHYREELNNETLNLATFVGARDSASEINTLYGSNIDDVQVEATNFVADASPSTDYTESGTDTAIQKVTLTKGDQTLITIFTE